MANELHGFKKARTWGVWKDESCWTVEQAEADGEMTAVSDLGQGKCPDCGADLNKWSKPVDTKRLIAAGAVEIGGSGYYKLPDIQFTGQDLPPPPPLDYQRLIDSYYLRAEAEKRHIARATDSARFKLKNGIPIARYLNLN